MGDDSNITAGLRELVGHLPRQRRRQLVGVVLTMLAGGVAELVTIGSVVPFLALLAGESGWHHFDWLHEVFTALGAHALDTMLMAATLVFMAAALIASAVRLYLTWTSQKLVSDLGHDLTVEIQRRVLAQPYGFHVEHNSSELIAAIEQVQVLVSGTLAQMMYAITAAVLSIFIGVALVQVDVLPAVIAAIAFAAIYGSISYVVRTRLRSASIALSNAHEQRIRQLQESVGGIRDVILDESQAEHLKAFRDIDGKLTAARTSAAFLIAAPRLVAEGTGLVLISFLALTLSGREGGLGPALPILGAIALGAQRLLPLVQQIYHSWGSLHANRSILGRILEMLRLPAGELDGASVEPLALREEIAFKGVTFSYPERRDALTDVSLTIPAGCKLAVVGRTGSGKSTFADLLLGLIEPTAGQILIDGQPLNSTIRRSWQKTIAHVPQSIFLADASIAANIAFGAAGPPDMHRVRQAALAAELDEFIAGLPQGYKTSIGERGVRLSGGQRQRVGIARAVYKRATVIVLDEATSALDEATEESVMHSLSRLASDHTTVIVIAHRQSTISHCDVVARLDSGRLVEVAPAPHVKSSRPS